MSEITAKMVAEHGLSEEEYQNVVDIMGREPNLTELGVFSVMWSEHCSYKSSKKWLKTLPTSAPWVICGPGENAGVVDIGDGQAIIFKMESHNHPSFIEPYQGAATGVGGILRDVFTMGARPIANMNALRFGSPDHPKTRYLVSGVVAGIGGYGNCIGVPTVGGETNFDASYDGNILVNAMTVGLADTNNIFYSAATGAGNSVVYVGSKTGRDGIHGATMASTEFSSDSEDKRPTVQVGDPFTEKLLVEACLELMATDVIVAIQDMGAAGLTSSAFEMASKGGVGVELDLDKVPAREVGMTAYEFLLSESQERMLMVIEPGKEHFAQAIMEKWELDFAIVGQLTNTGRMVIKMNGKVEADLPIDPLALASPEYDRPWIRTEPQAELLLSDDVKPINYLHTLRQILGLPDMCSRRWIWEQYDHMVMGNTVQRPGGDAAVIRIQGTFKGLAITTDCTPRYCYADPVEGGKQAVAETWRNITCVGAKPLAITDNMNFGNPEKPEIMGQFVGAIQGIKEACTVLEYPVVSGNVSLYNETAGKAILPTPAIGAVGIIADYRKSVGIAFQGEGEVILLIGETLGHLGQSIYMRDIKKITYGPPPKVDLIAERRNGDCVRSLIDDDLITACHDLSDGGLLVGLAEMSMASNIGAKINDLSGNTALLGWAYGEDQARYLVTTNDARHIISRCADNGVQVIELGTTGGINLSFANESITVAELKEAYEGWLPNYIAAIN
jgi:phosphoribosylformylglycinamidine synthase subunit PurL